MDAQITQSSDALSASDPMHDIAVPSTPQPQEALLREKSASPPLRPLSGASSMRSNRDKYTSPAPPLSSSMTPPPSSQLPQLNRVVRTPTPPTPHLSSPPLTSRNSAQIGHVGEVNTTLFSNEQIQNASAEELRDMVNELAGALRDARMSAAHYKLQFNMLCIESSEASNRMQVELAMAQREVEVLQQAEERRRSVKMTPSQSFHEPSISPANAILINDLNRQSQILRAENDDLRDNLEKSRKLRENREEALLAAIEENRHLRGRIRMNREHMNGLLDYVNDQGTPRSPAETPYQPATRNRLTGRDVSNLGGSGNRRDQQPFEALLLADKVLSQETVTAPATPTKSYHSKRYGHTRGTHSMSSLPSTPRRSRGAPLNPNLLKTPPNSTLHPPIPQSAPASQYQPDYRRRESSDSTITASSEGGGQKYPELDEVQESQASRAASSMLSRGLSQSQSTRYSDSSPPKNPPRAQVQTKLFGPIRKPGVGKAVEHEKRRFSGRDVLESPSKKGRVGEGVGLGIGGIHGGSRGI